MSQYKYSTKQYNGQLKGVDLIQHTLNEQVYLDNEQNLNFESQKEKIFTKHTMKLDTEGPLMKFDEESQTNLSDYEKETQITQTYQHVEDQDKLNIDRTPQKNYDNKNKNQSTPHHAFMKEISSIQDHKQKYPLNMHQKQKNSLISDITSEQQSNFSMTNRRSFNIFSDQKVMNQQILNETVDKKTLSSLKDIYQSRNQFEEKQLSTLKNRGTLTHFDDKQYSIEQSVTRLPTRYIDYQKHMKQLNSINEQNKVTQQGHESFKFKNGQEDTNNNSLSQQDQIKLQRVSSNQQQQDIINLNKKQMNEKTPQNNNIQAVNNLHNSQDQYKNENNNNNNVSQISISNTTASPEQNNQLKNFPQIQSAQTQKQLFNNVRNSDFISQKNINKVENVPDNQNSNILLSRLRNELHLGRTFSDIQPQKEKKYNSFKRNYKQQQSIQNKSNQQSQQVIVSNKHQKQDDQDDKNIKIFHEQNEISENIKGRDEKFKNDSHMSQFEDDQANLVIPIEHLIEDEDIDDIQKDLRVIDSKKDNLFQFQRKNDYESKNINQINQNDGLNPLKNRIQKEKYASQNLLPIGKPFQNLKQRSQKQRNQIEKNDILQANTQAVSSEASEIHLIQLSQDSSEEQQKKQNNSFKFNSQSSSKSPNKTKQLIVANYSKMATELQKDLSGCKQKLQQIEKIQILDQSFNENSFSDDSPSSHAQKIKEQKSNDINSGQNITIQQFKTQILSDYNIQSSETFQNQQDIQNNLQNKEKNVQINQQYTIKVKKCTNINKSNPFINEDYEINSPIQQEGDIHKNFEQISQSNENNLIIFSREKLDGSESQFQSSPQIDDYNNFVVPQNSQILQDNEIENFTDIEKQLDQNSNNFDKFNNQFSIENNREYKPKFESPLLKLSIDKATTNIIQFDTDDDLDRSEQQCEDEKNVQVEENSEQKQNDQQSTEQVELGIVTQFQVSIPLKQGRVQRFKYFSQNNTPVNNQKYSNSAKASMNVYESDKGIQKQNNRPSTFLSKFQQYKEQINFNSNENEIFNEQSNSQNQYQINQKNNDPFPSTPPQKKIENKSDDIINLNDSARDEEYITQNIQVEIEKFNNEQLFENSNNLSGDDDDDFDDEEDEDEDEYDLDDEVDEIEGDIEIIQNMQRRASSKNQDEQTDNSKQKNQFKEQSKYNQREIGIGKYFCEKLFNVFGDNKLFQKKKRRLKKWRKMIQFAEDRLQIKSQNRENYEYSPIENLSVLPSSTQTVQSSQQSANMNEFISSQYDSDQVYSNLSPMKMEKQQSTYSERIKIYQQKLLEQNKKQISKGIEGDTGLDNNEGIILNSQEEFELLYYFNKLKKNEFLKALKKGPPMWYRWSAWKVAIDLYVEDYQQLYENLRPKNNMSSSSDNNQPILNPIDKQIDKDITRTFPNEPFFSESAYASQSLESLRCILKAVSTHYSHVGYCQGMNFFAAYLLLINGGDELQTFAMFNQMEKMFNITSLFEEGFPLLQFMNFVFQREFGRRFQKLCRHFNQQKIPETMWVVQWFQTLFLNSVSLNVVCRFWDYIFCTGNILSIISISMSLIKEFNSHLIKMNIEEISQFTQKLKSCQVVKGEMRNSPYKPKPFILLLQKEQSVQDDNVIIDPDKIIKRAQMYEIPKREILSYISEFKQVNFLYRDKPFLQKLEDKINSQNVEIIQTKSQNPPKPFRQSSQVKSSFSQQNTPKKLNKDINGTEFQSLLHPNNPNSNEKKKSSFSIFSFYDKKQQKEM